MKIALSGACKREAMLLILSHFVENMGILKYSDHDGVLLCAKKKYKFNMSVLVHKIGNGIIL